MTHKKTFQELDLSNAFLFAAALEDQETCGLVIELILGKPVAKLKVKAEHSILYHSDFRSIRLDVYASDEEMQVEYNLEMQNQNERNLAKRSRFHQAGMDVTALKPGEGFEDLKPSYIIFICTFDPFGKGLFRYTFEERCIEEDFPLGDETQKVFLNTKGKRTERIPNQLIQFLNYVEESTDAFVSTVNDTTIQKLHGKIKRLKESRELEVRYMTIEELMQIREKEARKEGIKEGIREERTRMMEITKRMITDGDGDKVMKLLEDDSFYESMLEKYGQL